MSIRRITISVPEKTARKLKKAAGKQPVSAYLTGLIEERLTADEFQRLWEEFYRSVPMTKKDIAEGDAMYARLTRRPRRRRAA